MLHFTATLKKVQTKLILYFTIFRKWYPEQDITNNDNLICNLKKLHIFSRPALIIVYFITDHQELYCDFEEDTCPMYMVKSKSSKWYKTKGKRTHAMRDHTTDTGETCNT